MKITVQWAAQQLLVAPRGLPPTRHSATAKPPPSPTRHPHPAGGPAGIRTSPIHHPSPRPRHGLGEARGRRGGGCRRRSGRDPGAGRTRRNPRALLVVDVAVVREDLPRSLRELARLDGRGVYRLGEPQGSRSPRDARGVRGRRRRKRRRQRRG